MMHAPGELGWSPDARRNAGAPIRFAVVSSSEFGAQWEHACVRALIDSGEAQLAAIYTLAHAPSRVPLGMGERVYEAIVRRRSQALLGQKKWMLDIDLAAKPLGGSASPFQDVDFVLSFVQPQALFDIDLPPLGLWWFRLGGSEHGCGTLPFLEDIASSRPTLEFQLLRHVTGSSEPHGLSRVVRKARRSHSLSVDLLLEVAPAMCVGACRRIRVEPHTAMPTADTERTLDQRGLAAKAVLAQAVGTAVRAVRRSLVTDVWTVGVLPATADDVIAGAPIPEPVWLADPRPGEFHADPFPLALGGSQYLLYEHFDTRIGRGRIAATEIGAPGSEPFRNSATIMPMDYHMSYPATFHYEGSTYCAPEVSERGGLTFYRLGSSAQDWTFVCSIMEDVPLLDSTLFEHEGRWWLLATIEGSASDVDLFAWYAQAPFGPWTAHRLNPIKSDVFAARPAGSVFRAQGALYRPAQDCSRGYGYGVAICRIVRLDPDHFEEVEVRRLRPERNWAWPDGMHTFNVWDDRIFVDARRWRFRRQTFF